MISSRPSSPPRSCATSPTPSPVSLQPPTSSTSSEDPCFSRCSLLCRRYCWEACEVCSLLPAAAASPHEQVAQDIKYSPDLVAELAPGAPVEFLGIAQAVKPACTGGMVVTARGAKKLAKSLRPVFHGIDDMSASCACLLPMTLG
eukprot:747543-Hanusia_phi.AAC.4